MNTVKRAEMQKYDDDENLEEGAKWVIRLEKGRGKAQLINIILQKVNIHILLDKSVPRQIVFSRGTVTS